MIEKDISGNPTMVRFVLSDEEATFLHAYKVSRGHRGIGGLAHELLAERIQELIKSTGFVPPKF